MNKVDEAVNTFKSGVACSQAILGTYGPGEGIPRELAFRLASGFAGGMGMADTCGAVTGAFMVLGLKMAGPDSQTPQGRAAAKAAVLEFGEKFKARRGSLMCRDLLGCDIGTKGGLEQARQQGLFASICPGIVQDAAELLEQALAKNRS